MHTKLTTGLHDVNDLTPRQEKFNIGSSGPTEVCSYASASASEWIHGRIFTPNLDGFENTIVTSQLEIDRRPFTDRSRIDRGVRSTVLSAIIS